MQKQERDIANVQETVGKKLADISQKYNHRYCIKKFIKYKIRKRVLRIDIYFQGTVFYAKLHTFKRKKRDIHFAYAIQLLGNSVYSSALLPPNNWDTLCGTLYLSSIWSINNKKFRSTWFFILRKKHWHQDV